MPETFRLNGRCISRTNLADFAPQNEAEAQALAFLRDWYAPAPTMQLQTSGSTGTPKRITVTKDAMRASAARSCDAFGLRTGSTALLPLPLSYVAGKMMMVRALVAGLHLHLVEPSSSILCPEHLPLHPGGWHFAPVIPMQLRRLLQEPAGTAAAQLQHFRCLLIGGGFVDADITAAVSNISTRVFVSYGMTETLSHIALRRLNGPDAGDYYTPLPGTTVTLSPQGTLTITAPHLGINAMPTNDLAHILPDGRFRILGRRDAVINSGGVKIQAEDIEHKLRHATGLPLIIIGTPHPLLGECVTLLWELPAPIAADQQLRALSQAADRLLPPYARPKRYLHTSSLPRTSSGKIARAACRDLALSLLDRQLHQP